MKKTARFCTFAENGGIIRPEGIFSKHFGLIHLAGLRVLKHFFGKKTTSISLHFPFHLLSSFSSCFFSCLAHSLFFFVLSLLLSCSFSLLVFSLLLSSLFFSCLVSLSLSLSVSLCFCLSLSPCGVVCCVVCCVVLCCVCGVVCGAAWHAENASVCRFKTSPCEPAPRAHVLPHAGVVPVHTGTF